MRARLGPTHLLAATLVALCLAGVVEAAVGDRSASPAQLRARREQVERDRALTEEARGQAMALLDRALEDAERAATQLDTAQRLRDDAAAAEGLVSELRDEAVRPAPEIVVPATISSAAVRQERAAAESRLDAARTALDLISAEQLQRGSRRGALPGLLAEARARLEAARRERARAAARDDVPAVVAARTLALEAAERAAQAELAALEAELETWDEITELLAARREYATAEVARAEAAAAAWELGVSASLRREAEAASAKLRATVAATPALGALAEENVRLAERRAAETSPAQRRGGAAGRLRAAQAELDRVRGEFAETRTRIETFGVGRVGALLLRTRQGQLPSVAEIGTQVVRRSAELQSVQIQESQLVSERVGLVGRVEAEADAAVAALEAPLPEDRLETVRAAARDLLEDRLRHLDALIEDTESYLTVLFDLDSAQRELIAETLRFSAYLDEMVLWTPSAGILTPRDLASAARAVPWVLDPRAWTLGVPALAASIGERPASTILLVAGLALLGLLRRTRRPAATRGARLARDLCDVAFPPLLLWAVGWALAAAPDAPLVMRAVGVALQRIFVGALIASAVRVVCRRGTAAGFGWSASRIAALRRANRWFAVLLLPAAGLAEACLHAYRGGAGAWADSACRVALLVSLVALFIVVREALHPDRGVLVDRLSAAPAGWLSRLRWIWFGTALAVPLGLVWLDVAGYGHTAAALLEALVTTGGVVLVAAVADRWLRGHGAPSTDGRSAAPAADFGSGRLRLVLGAALFVILGSVWADVLPALGYLKNVELWTVETDGAREAVSAAELLRFVLIVVIGIVAARAVPGLNESVLGRLPVDVNLRYGIGMVAQYVVVIVAGISAFEALHVGWSKLQWLAAGLSVGVGFGLQEIVANFIAGLIILFERPIRIGDVVTVGDTTGTVTRIHARSTTVRDFDGKEMIVPNKELITSRVTNWDLSDRVTRIQIAIGVAYGSDTARVEEILLRAARECPHAIQEPPPRAVFTAFGDNALQFLLYVFLPSRESILDARHALHSAIERAMREAGIEIAFPQRDVRLDSRGPLRVRIEAGPGDAPPRAPGR